VIKNKDHWVLPIEGRAVSEIRIYRFYVDFYFPGDDGVTFWLRLETPFSYRGPDGTALLIDPEGPRRALGPVLGIFGLNVHRALAYNFGVLDLRFADGSSLTAEPDGQYEAWEFHSDNGILVVPHAGNGELMVWLDLT
jgi:hypothetical protein